MAKAPVPGTVKTRLCPPLTPRQAADLCVAFATDVLDGLRTVAVDGGLEVRLAIDETLASQGVRAGSEPSAADRLRAEAARRGVAIEPQSGGDLGARMADLVARGLREGVPTLLVGSDVPDLPFDRVLAAVAALGRTDAVLVPSPDGGYVLVGARRPLDALFTIDAPWSSAQVFSATCASLTKSECPFETLPAWEDVDDAAALGRLAARLAAAVPNETPDDVVAATAGAPATARLFERWRRGGVPI